MYNAILILANDAAHVLNLQNDARANERQFEKCTSYSVKSKNDSLPQDNVSTQSTNSIEKDSDLGKTKVHMENKPKDINQLYREMEEAVAKRVKETMELADARRRALAEGTLIINQKQITNIDYIKDKAQLTAETSHNIAEHINKQSGNEDVTQKQELTTEDDYLKKEEIRQEFEDINKSIEEEQARIYRVIKTNDGVKDIKSAISKTEEVLQVSKIKHSMVNLLRTAIFLE